MIRERKIRHRINRRNLRTWAAFRRRTMFCNVCGVPGPLYFEMQDLDTLARHRIGMFRETLRCTKCGSKMRDRTIAEALLETMANNYDVTTSSIAGLAKTIPAGLSILDTDAENRLSERLRGSPGYLRSLYVSGKASGEVLDATGVLNVDLEDMPFPDGHFDVILTSEVMEHVRHVERAHREIARCLRPGGTYLFTVPYDDQLAETWRLIDPETDVPLVDPPHIHGDPLRSGGIKSYRVFGRDIVDDLAAVGLEAEFKQMDRPDIGVYGGDVFVARRPLEHR